MSEPRKLYTAGATGSSEQEQYEAARRRAQQLAEQNARRRTVQQPMRTAQGRHISQRPAARPEPEPIREPIQEPVQQPVQQAAPQPDAPRGLTYAQRQAMAYRAAAERKYGDTLQFQVQRPRRTVNRPQAAPDGGPAAGRKPPVRPACGSLAAARPLSAPAPKCRKWTCAPPRAASRCMTSRPQAASSWKTPHRAAPNAPMRPKPPQAAMAAASPRVIPTTPRASPKEKSPAKKAATARAAMAKRRKRSAGGRSCLSRCWSLR